jgi:hypothetical protein
MPNYRAYIIFPLRVLRTRRPGVIRGIFAAATAAFLYAAYYFKYGVEKPKLFYKRGGRLERYVTQKLKSLHEPYRCVNVSRLPSPYSEPGMRCVLFIIHFSYYFIIQSNPLGLESTHFYFRWNAT